MARKKKKIKEEVAEVPIASMIDVVFLLLIFFIVTSKPIIDEAFVAVNLPGPPSDQPAEPPVTYDIYVQSDAYHCMGKQYDLEQIGNYLMSAKGMLMDSTINIKCSVKAPHHKLVKLLDKMSAARLEKFSLHTLKDPVSQ